ncbi:MAG: zinc-binding dehydrogenase [Firmicutes bacterium]|nr:zinc-binding dehydrogenase [Bacillota bacterium]
MKAAVLTEPYKINLKKVDKPVPRKGEVLVKVLKAGICGSEIHAFKGMHPKRKPPVILGHEMVGIVESIGTGVKKIKEGDKVTVEPQMPCLKCEDCSLQNYNVCQNKKILGTKQWSGSFAEYLVAPEMVLYKIPDKVSDLSAVMIEPLSVAIHSIKRYGLFSEKMALIIGAGTIGLLCLQVARAYGYKRIIVTDILDYNLQLASKLGADLVLNPRKDNTVERISNYTGKHGADVVLMTAGNQQLMEDALGSVANKGMILPIAHFPDHAVSINTPTLRYKEAIISGTVMYTQEDFLEAIRLLNEENLEVESIITHQLPLEKVEKGIKLVDQKIDNAIKVILNLN